MNTDDFEIKLESAILNKHSGQAAQTKMIPTGRPFPDLGQVPSNAKQSAVLILLYKDSEGDWCFPLIFRTKDGSKHSGQISFPGGKYEKSDNSLAQTALRETYEELGILPENINIFGKLTDLYIPVSNFNVAPYLAIATKKPTFIPSKSEVEKVVLIKVNELLNPKIVEKVVRVRGDKFKAPFFEFKNASPWGATAMILSEFSDIIKQIS